MTGATGNHGRPTDLVMPECSYRASSSYGLDKERKRPLAAPFTEPLEPKPTIPYLTNKTNLCHFEWCKKVTNRNSNIMSRDCSKKEQNIFIIYDILYVVKD
jgi:hypothetical protein